MATIKDIAHILTEKYNLNGKDADFFTTSFVETIIEGLTADRLVKIKGLGTFKIQSVKERSSVNVNTGERVLINGHDKINFTPDNTLRDLVNKPFAQFETVTLADDVDVEALTAVEEEEAEESVVEPRPIVQEHASVVSEPVSVASETDISSTVDIDLTQEPEPVVSEQEPKINPYVIPIINKEEEAPVVEELKVVEEKEPEVQELQQEIQEPQPEIHIEEPRVEVNELVHQPVETKPEVKEVAETGNVENKEEETYDEDDGSISSEEYHHCRKMFFIYATIVTILLAIAAFFAGYYCSEYNLLGCNNDAQNVQCPAAKPQVKPTKVQQKATQKPISVKHGCVTIKDDVKKEVTPAKQEATISAKQEDVQTKQETAKTKQVEEKKPIAMTQYNSDVRIRTGAYAIVGTKTTHTVKAGQTATSIAKTYLGPGMECYVEAYNGGRTDFKAGEKIKIPELMLKKKTGKIARSLNIYQKNR